MVHQFKYKSTGKSHNEEDRFFHFVIKSRFQEQGNRSIQWCKFIGLTIICETVEPSIVDYVKMVLRDVIETNNGHRYELV